MIVIYFNGEGTAEKLSPEHVYQGSNQSGVLVFAPTPPQTAMGIAFKLPDGTSTPYYPMTYQGNYEGLSQYEYTMPTSITQLSGQAAIAVQALYSDGQQNSQQVDFEIEPSVVVVPPAPMPDVYDLLKQAIAKNAADIAGIQGQIDNIEDLAERAEEASSNAVATANEAKATADGLAESIAQANETAQQAVSTANGAVEDIAKYKSDTDADIAQFKQSVNEEIADITATANGAVDTANEANATADGLAESIAQANTTASEAKEIAEEALEQSKVTGTKVNVDGAFQSDLNFDSNPQEQLNDLKSADTALQNGKVNKSGDTMTGKLDMAGNAAIWNGNDSTFIEIGKVGRSGFEFHAQTNPNVYRDYDATIQATEANSTTADGSAKLNYIAREHNFQGGGIFENGQRVYSANNLPSSLFIQDTRNTDEFNEDIFPGRRLVPFFTNVNMPTNDWWSGIYVKGWQDHYKAWQLVGDASNNFAYDRPLYVREIDTVNKTAKGWQALLSVDPSKLEPTTANGWTVGDKKLAISSDGIYLVSVNNSEAGIMIVSSSTTVNMLTRGGVAFVYSYSHQAFYVKYSQAGDSLMTWLAYKCSDDSKVEIDSVAYKKIA